MSSRPLLGILPYINFQINFICSSTLGREDYPNLLLVAITSKEAPFC